MQVGFRILGLRLKGGLGIEAFCFEIVESGGKFDSKSWVLVLLCRSHPPCFEFERVLLAFLGGLFRDGFEMVLEFKVETFEFKFEVGLEFKKGTFEFKFEVELTALGIVPSAT